MGVAPWARVPSGLLAAYAPGFEAWLAARGYSPHTIGHRLWQLELVSRWLASEGLAVGDLTPERFVEFTRARGAAGYRSWVSPLGGRLPLGYLREIGVAPAPVVEEGPVERVLEDYRRYLLFERGAVPETFLAFVVMLACSFPSGLVRAGLSSRG